MDSKEVKSADKPRRIPPNAGKGRKAGVPNKVTQEFRETIRQLLENNADNVNVWLTQVALGDDDNKADPKGALDLLAKLAEFAAPKLARTEMVGDNTAPVVHIYKWQDD
jgi:citrate lyase gamma subunit